MVQAFAKLGQRAGGQASMQMRPGAAQAPNKELRLLAKLVAGPPDFGRRAWCSRRLRHLSQKGAQALVDGENVLGEPAIEEGDLAFRHRIAGLRQAGLPEQ